MSVNPKTNYLNSELHPALYETSTIYSDLAKSVLRSLMANEYKKPELMSEVGRELLDVSETALSRIEPGFITIQWARKRLDPEDWQRRVNATLSPDAAGQVVPLHKAEETKPFWLGKVPEKPPIQNGPQIEKIWQDREIERQMLAAQQREVMDMIQNDTDFRKKFEGRQAEIDAREEIRQWEHEEEIYIQLKPDEVQVVTIRETCENQWELTPSELEIFKLLPLGMADKELSKQLFLSPLSVKGYLRSIFNKTNTHDRLAAAVLAYKSYGEELKSDIKLDTSLYATLSPSEKRILPLIGEGFSNDEIATSLAMNLETLKSQVKRVFDKLGINRKQAGVFMVELQRNGEFSNIDELEPTVEMPAAHQAKASGTAVEPPVFKTSRPAASRETEVPEPDFRPKLSKIPTHERRMRKNARIKSLAIMAARKVVKVIPSDNLASFEELRFSLKNDEELFEALLRNGLISEEEHRDHEVGAVGVAAAMVIGRTQDGRKLLDGTKQTKNREAFIEAVKKEIIVELHRVQQSRRAGTR